MVFIDFMAKYQFQLCPIEKYLIFKQGLFAVKSRLVYNAKKPCLRCKQGFF